MLIRMAAALALAMVVTGAFAALAAHGGRVSDRLDVAAHFAPIQLWMVLAGAALTLLTPRSRLRAATVGIAAVGAPLALLLVWPELTRAESRAPAGAEADLKLIQFNIWGGRNRDLEGTLDWLYAQDADVVVMQEVKPRVLDAVARRGGYHVTCERRYRCQTVILSRAPPLETGVPDVTRRAHPSSARATLPLPDGSRFTVVGVHYTWPIPAGPQQAQGRELSATLGQFPKERLIVSGDFNSTPWSFSRRREDRDFGLERRTRMLFSWPAARPAGAASPLPFLPIDHVYAGPAWRTVSVERGPRLGSDHYPVVVRLALAP
ncbi:endonuclease/exonuclease/phosphatase family protein [Phenylobacterium terrae]|uniref:endonuclease/exonuclease/phosphatase family protein n=1 Tax=Phenylobacterium terrae TaxID=2665495 RepID=UPI00366F660C